MIFFFFDNKKGGNFRVNISLTPQLAFYNPFLLPDKIHHYSFPLPEEKKENDDFSKYICKTFTNL